MKKYAFELTGRLKDGTVVVIDGDYIVGSKVFAIDESGQKAPLFDGDHELESGDIFVTVNGEITEIKPMEVNNEVEVEVDAPEDTAPVIEYATKAEVEELKKMIEDMKAKMSEMSIDVDTKVQEKFNEIQPSSILDNKVEPVKLSRTELILSALEKFEVKNK